jgi:4-oxalocrotonate tautomerase
VSLVEGRSPEQLTALVIALTDAAQSAIDAPLDSIRVVLREVPATHWAAAGTTIAERRATADSSPLPASSDDRTTP